MKNTFLRLIIALLPFSASQALAHEEGTEITNLAEADWIGPAVAIIIIAGAIVIARIIRKRSSRQIINNNVTN